MAELPSSTDRDVALVNPSRLTLVLWFDDQERNRRIALDKANALMSEISDLERQVQEQEDAATRAENINVRVMTSGLLDERYCERMVDLAYADWCNARSKARKLRRKMQRLQRRVDLLWDLRNRTENEMLQWNIYAGDKWGDEDTACQLIREVVDRDILRTSAT